MYKLEFLPSAKKDIEEIAYYITTTLCNPTAAVSLVENILNAAENLVDMPYSCPLYYPLKPLKKEYRKLLVKNYMLFFYVDESNKTVTVAKVIYARRSINDYLN